jgi:uracil phosphoribosyltransferase
MQETETIEIIALLLNKAQENKHTEIRLITTWREFRAFKKQAKALKVVIKILRNSANSLLKVYCKEVVEGTQDFTKLLAYNQLLEVSDYYKRELEIVNEMITEYDKYLDDCNYIATLLGEVREV